MRQSAMLIAFMTSADTRSCALLCFAANASASNSCLREEIEVSGENRKVNTGSTSMNRISAIRPGTERTSATVPPAL